MTKEIEFSTMKLRVVNMKQLIIQKNEIQEILEKYNIGKKPLSLVLGWGEVTIIRYLDGQIPDQFHSEILFKIKEDYRELAKYLEKNKDLITDLAYKKVIGKISELKLEEDKSNIYLISKHIIANMEDITPLALQKILYYIEGFSLALLDKNILSTSCEAWIHGPVYREIYERFCYYQYHPIEKEEFSEYAKLENLNAEEVKLIEQVINSFGCYSGKVLENMTHTTIPWINARKDVETTERSNQLITEAEMKNFFKKVCLEYQISSSNEISRYSKKMFRKVVR